MGKIKDFVEDVTGASAVDKAARQQERAINDSISLQRETRDLARGDLQPFREAGEAALSGGEGRASLNDLISNPQSQLDFIQNNPFFNALADQAKNDLLSNQAASGKVGSGGTAEALQNSLLLLGTDLINNQFNQRMNLATLGSNAAAGQSNIAQNVGNNISNLTLEKGNVQAGATLGSKQANISFIKDLAQTAASAKGAGAGGAGSGSGGAQALCDIRAKEDISRIGTLDNGLPVYFFKYKGDEKYHVNVMAQDVEKVMPEAVFEIDGLKHINMRKIWQ